MSDWRGHPDWVERLRAATSSQMALQHDEIKKRVEQRRLEKLMSHTYPVIDTVEKFAGHICSVRVDTVIMPGGTKEPREVVTTKDAVAIVAIDNSFRIALIKQYRHPLGTHILELPAGKLDVEGESTMAAAERELAEEIGFKAAMWQELVTIAVSPGFTTEKVHVYLAQGITETTRPDMGDNEESEIVLEWYDLDTAMKMVSEGEIISAHTVAGIMATYVRFNG